MYDYNLHFLQVDDVYGLILLKSTELIVFLMFKKKKLEEMHVNCL